MFSTYYKFESNMELQTRNKYKPHDTALNLIKIKTPQHLFNQIDLFLRNVYLYVQNGPEDQRTHLHSRENPKFYIQKRFDWTNNDGREF